MVTLLPILTACAPEPGPDEAVDHLLRASMATRGVLPDPDEVRAVHANPETLPLVVRSWREDPRLGDVVRDMHAEQLVVRTDAQPTMPSIGALSPYRGARVAQSLQEAPLKLVEHVVVSGRPYTDVVTTADVLADEIVSRAYGPPIDPDGPEWQVTTWTDGRPAAGILSSTTLWNRHMSANTSYHRSRAAVVVDALLCDDLSGRALAGAVDPVQAEDAVRTDPGCVACHAVLDPIAGAMWGFRRYALPREVTEAHERGCPNPDDPFCYPLGFWDPQGVDDRASLGLPDPALYGEPVPDLGALGQAIARDPRFADCTARRFWSWMTRTDPASAPEAVVAELADALVASGWDARELMIAAATHPEFAEAPPAAVRPEQLARAIEALTGARWAGVAPDPSWGEVDLATTDRFGFRTLLGGLDGWDVTASEPGALPTRELAHAWLAEEAARAVVQGDALGDPPLLIHGLATDERAAREQLARLHLAVLAEVVDPRGSQVDSDWALLHGLLERSDPAHAWTVVLAAFLQDPRLAVL